MKDLIDLLNSFCREKRGDYVVTKYREKEHSFDTFVEWKVDYMTDLYVVSKRCWFIQRLIENDKIDLYTILKDNWNFRVKFFAIAGRKDYERLIMLLSISDTPIQDLVSFLKNV